MTTPPFDSNIEVTVLWKDPLQASLYMNGTRTDKSNVFNSRLPLNHITFDKEGTYTCRAYYTVNGRQSPRKRRIYYLAISESSYSIYTPWSIILSYLFAVSIGLANPSVYVIGSGSREAGSSYTLTCTVSLSVRARGNSVSIQWEGPGISTTAVNDDSSDKEISRHLALDPLTLAHRGIYTCTATYMLNGRQTSGNGRKNIIVTSKWPHSSLSVYQHLATYHIAVPSPSVTLTLGGRVKETALVGEDVVLYCNIQLYGVKRGGDAEVDVTWRKDVFKVANSTRVIYSGPAGYGARVHSTVTFSPVKVSDSALYQCLVTVTSLQGQPTVTAHSQYLLSVPGIITMLVSLM